MTIVSHRRERKGRREKTFFVVKEKDYFTAENAENAEKMGIRCQVLTFDIDRMLGMLVGPN